MHTIVTFFFNKLFEYYVYIILFYRVFFLVIIIYCISINTEFKAKNKNNYILYHIFHIFITFYLPIFVHI